MRQFNLEEYLTNPNQKIVTRNGESVRIICTDREGGAGFPIVALIKFRDREGAFIYSLNGQCCDSKDNELDLFFATENTDSEEKTNTPMATAKITQGGTSMKQFNLEEYLDNPQKKVITRDGKSARIVCTDKRGLNVKPIAALITMPNGDEVIETYWENGVATRGCKDNPYDLFFATEKKTKWLNVYINNYNNPIVGCFFETKEKAIEYKSTMYAYIDTIKIEVEE